MIKIRIFKQTNVNLSVSRVEQSKHYKLNSDQSSANLALVRVEFLHARLAQLQAGG
jgi:hypothetical protein